MGTLCSPLIGRIVLIFIAIIIRLFISLLTSKWIRYLIILIFLGGIIILFIYICTLISNVKSFVTNFYDYTFTLIGLFFIINRIVYYQYWDLRAELRYISISLIYLKSNIILISICVFYLLLVLEIRVNLSQKHKGSLKAKTYDR